MKFSEWIMLVIYVVLAVFLILYLGEMVISWSPFSIRMEAWDKLVGILLIILGACFIRSYHFRTDRDEFFRQVREYLDKEIVRDSEIESSRFTMVMYRGNTKELRTKLEEIGYMPLSSPKEGGYILVAGDRYSIISEIDESMPELYDCGTDEDKFLDLLKDIKLC